MNFLKSYLHVITISKYPFDFVQVFYIDVERNHHLTTRDFKSEMLLIYTTGFCYRIIDGKTNRRT